MKEVINGLKVFTILFLILLPNIENVHTNSGYEIIWKRFWGLEYKNDIGARQLAIGLNNSIFVCGHNGSEGIILLYNETGNLLCEYRIVYDDPDEHEVIHIGSHLFFPFKEIWKQFFSFPEKGFVEVMDIKTNPISNEVFVLGSFQSVHGGNYTFVSKYIVRNSSFHEVWTKFIEDCMAYAFTIDENGNIYVPLISVSLFSKYIIKISSDGEIIYTRCLKPFRIIIPLDIQINEFTKKIVMSVLNPKIFFPKWSKTGIIEINPENGYIIDEKWVITPLIPTRDIQWPHQAIAFSPNGDIFVSWSVVNSKTVQSKLIKFNRDLNILFEKTLPYVVTDMVVFRNEVITSGALLSINGEKNYGSIVYNASDGEILFIIDLGPIINSFNPFPTNRMNAIEIDEKNNIIISGGEGIHSDSFGCVSAIETIKLRLKEDAYTNDFENMTHSEEIIFKTLHLYAEWSSNKVFE